MVGSKYDVLDLQRTIAEGEAETHLQHRSMYGQGQTGAPNFLRMIILEVISDPATLDDTKLAYYEHVLAVSNIKYAAVAPRNSIIARRVMGGDSASSEKVMVLYPFFPPHLSFPAKAGEHVWAMLEHSDAKTNEIGYWFCRIVEPHFVEDVNYTHSNRQFDPSFTPGIARQFNGKDDAKYEFSNGAVDSKNDSRYTYAGTASIPGDENSYETLLKETDASKLTRYESVPRYRKRPADTAFEGSNNTLIVLGTDRSGPISDYESDPIKGKIPKPVTDDIATDGIGVIDLVAGRGQTDATSGKSVKNKLDRKELGKSKKELVEKEGDVDLKSDRSRIMISQRVPVDKRFGLDTYNTSSGKGVGPGVVDEGDGDGAIIIKTDKIRIIARADVQILVEGATQRDDKGNIVSEPDITKWASFTIKKNGDIVFVPAEPSGVIRLGGDDAMLSPLCTRVGNTPGKKGPIVGVPPIIDTMGGSQGGADAMNGTFATRVLLK